jgi:hypothetical protein
VYYIEDIKRSSRPKILLVVAKLIIITIIKNLTICR